MNISIKATRKKTVSLILAFLLTLSIFTGALNPITAKAADATASYSTTIYGTENYFQIKSNKAILFTTSWIPQGTIGKGTIVTPGGKAFSRAGLDWLTIRIDNTIYYILRSSVKKCANTLTASLVRVTKDNAPLRSTPYETGSVISRIPQGTLLRVTGTVINKHQNLWYQVFLQGDSTPRYIYGGNVSSSYATTDNLRIDMDVYFQTKNYSCSAAAPLAILRYSNTALNVSDVTLLKTTKKCIGGVEDALDDYLGDSVYRYSTFKKISSYEAAIRKSLAQGSPVVARIKFKKGYFNYKSDGHLTVINGIYTKDGKTWLEITDSFVNRYSSNKYSNATTGTVHIPLSTLFDYGDYNNTSPVYLVYNP